MMVRVPTRVLFVCLGNICRSPIAEAVMRSLVAEQGLQAQIEVDSAGTGDWHVGQRPDARAREAAARRGFAVTGRARQVSRRDFVTYDLLLAMDSQNLQDLQRIAPPGTEQKVRMLAAVDVPDPFYGPDGGFETVLDIVTAGCAALLDELDPG
jgi:protein-tyrosine phosphatase